jgi:predicted RNA-binding protein Jag
LGGKHYVLVSARTGKKLDALNGISALVFVTRKKTVNYWVKMSGFRTRQKLDSLDIRVRGKKFIYS